MIIHANRLLTPAGWRKNMRVFIEKGVIAALEPGDKGDRACEILAPGYFDVHCHGGEGYYSLRGDEESLRRYLLGLARRGVTDLLIGVSTYTDRAGYFSALDFIRGAMEKQKKGLMPGAVIQGVHLEGPFLNPRRCGAMTAEAMLAPSVKNYLDIFSPYGDIVRLVTLAPELEGARELTAYLVSRGVCVQAGHTDATCEEAEAAFGWGVSSLCHTFNAARPIHHRDPGVVNAALLSDGVFCEAICDLKHLHPNTLKLIYRMKGPDRMLAISDSVTVTGLPDGEHVIAGQKYLIVDGTMRVKGGNTLSGGACFLDGGVRNLVSIGIPVEHALKMAAQTPAARMNMTDIGAVRPGAQAHLTALDESLTAKFTVIGEEIYE